MAEVYERPAQALTVELEIKNSRFICHAAPTRGAAAAQAFIDDIRGRYPDASHNCWCYVAGSPGDYNLWNSSDDGEPRGTAGKPMLNVLQHSGLGEVTVVVTRYFGGIKLGAGGLVRAYSLAVQNCLSELTTEAVIPTRNLRLLAPHRQTGSVEQLLRQLGLEVSDRHWGEELELSLELTEDQHKALEQRLAPFPDVRLVAD
ncbi:YigZ family protein [Marinobacterium nitratireducens]|uniref:YigZ family protein n=1 Tax=Marinobacterium nitratireducens TaxID=518897 RepID=A0A918DP28_9GAMM|nr:YigZ family protein [Marinobacterium nitratireducens]GGO75757.1 YigZ family protein [Marinobacterium nitratireducens]